MDLKVLLHILAGSTFGLILRLFIKYNFKTKIGFNFNTSLIVNVLSSLFLGISVALTLTNKYILLFSFSFLGCFSTFSSFIYQLFNLIYKRKYIRTIIYYIEVIILSFLFFSLGYFFVSLIIKN